MGWLELFCFAIPLLGFGALPVNAEGWQSNKECSVMQTHTSYYPSCYLSLVTACVPERAVAWCFDRFLAQFRKVIGRYHG